MYTIGEKETILPQVGCELIEARYSQGEAGI
jgi:hypothetical protein